LEIRPNQLIQKKLEIQSHVFLDISTAAGIYIINRKFQRNFILMAQKSEEEKRRYVTFIPLSKQVLS